MTTHMWRALEPSGAIRQFCFEIQAKTVGWLDSTDFEFSAENNPSDTYQLVSKPIVLKTCRKTVEIATQPLWVYWRELKTRQKCPLFPFELETQITA